ncbi:conjugal transfer protein TraN [Pantoea ananatis]
MTSQRQPAARDSQCVDPGGNRTINQNGRDYTQYSDCWQYSDAYIVPVTSTGNCDQLINNRNCTLAGRSCSQSEAGPACTKTTRISVRPRTRRRD